MKRQIRRAEPRPIRIEYEISVDRAFLGFSADCGVKPEELFDQAEEAIRMRHHAAVPDRALNGEIRYGVWCLDFGPACVIYSLNEGTAIVQEYLCNANGDYYQPSQDLLAGMVVATNR